MSRIPPQKAATTAPIPYTLTRGLLTVQSDNPPVSLAMLTRAGYHRLPEALPGEWARCKHPTDGGVAVILDEAAILRGEIVIMGVAL